MDRVAVFVDAGYLFAQGSSLLTGSKKPRLACSLDDTVLIDRLRTTAHQIAGVPLLRVYWYDGVTPRGMNSQQDSIAHRPDVKLRLGFVNSQGEQKGVDSLIVTDLIDLARNRAMSDALVTSGDEDVRVGVQVAQSYGVRVHLLGIVPARGSQSKQLLQEADTTAEWDHAVVDSFLKVVDLPMVLDGGQQQGADVPEALYGTLDDAAMGEVEVCARRYVGLLSAEQRAELTLHCASNGSIPGPYDRSLLSLAGKMLSRWLDETEKRSLRARVIELVRKPPG
ncbi:MAG TPA: NYN domain-containing protein [Acetobacteraceae bacterium]|jgi:uncharacterized LabA/DUF88 family protein